MTKTKDAYTGCAIMLIGLPLLVLLRGWVFAVLWGWFVVPLGASTITIAWAIGLSALVTLARGVPEPSKPKGDPSSTEIATAAVTRMLAVDLGALAIGAIAHAAM